MASQSTPSLMHHFRHPYCLRWWISTRTARLATVPCGIVMIAHFRSNWTYLQKRYICVFPCRVRPSRTPAMSLVHSRCRWQRPAWSVWCRKNPECARNWLPGILADGRASQVDWGFIALNICESDDLLLNRIANGRVLVDIRKNTQPQHTNDWSDNSGISLMCNVSRVVLHKTNIALTILS